MNECFAADRALLEYCGGQHFLTVRGVFSAAIYLSDESGKVLMLHDAGYGTLPFGLAVRDLKGRGRELGIYAENPAILGMGELCFPNAELSLRVLPLAGEPHPDWIPDTGKFGTAAREALERAEASLRIYTETIVCDTAEDPFAAAAYKGMDRLCRGMITASRADIRAGLDNLIGLGRGLTPSCDDFITGLLFFLGYIRDCGGPAAAGLSALQEEVRALAEQRTNLFSAAYLLAAADGGDFSLMRRCIEEPGEEELSSLLAVGSSSGADMLSGMCFAEALLHREFPDICGRLC